MKTRVPRWISSALLGALVAGAGCTTTTTKHQVNTLEPANPAYTRTNIEDKRIIRDKSVAKSVAILNVIQGSTPDGLLRIGVEVQNQNNKVFRFNYRFDWFDGQGFPVNTPTTTMISQQIEGGQILILDSVAPNPGAKDFRLTLQESTRAYYPRLPKN